MTSKRRSLVLRERGLDLEGRATIEGEWAGRVTGLSDQHVKMAMMRTRRTTAGSVSTFADNLERNRQFRVGPASPTVPAANAADSASSARSSFGLNQFYVNATHPCFVQCNMLSRPHSLQRAAGVR
jgi:hypothetical protein